MKKQRKKGKKEHGWAAREKGEKQERKWETEQGRGDAGRRGEALLKERTWLYSNTLTY